MPGVDDAGGSPSADSAPEMPLVSVIMIFLDAERFIEEAIDSVLAQTYAAWELVLVDDGSSDASTRIARRHAELRPGQVRYLEHDGHANRGMSASRNAGIAASRGELIAFLDADDVYRPEKLERQVETLDGVPQAAMVYGPTQHWYSWTGNSVDVQRDCLRTLGVAPDTLVQPPALVPLFLNMTAKTPGSCGLLVRRDAVERVGGFEERFRGMFEDQVFVFKLCLSAAVFVEHGSWDRYRQHPDSCSRRSSEDYRRRPTPSHRTFLEWLEQYMTTEGICDRQTWRALRKALWRYRHPVAYQLSREAGARRLRAARGRIAGRASACLRAAARIGPRVGGRADHS